MATQSPGRSESLISSDQPLAGKVALITGGGRGIALAYADAGADVAVVSRTQSQLDEVVGEITARGRRASGLVCDVTDLAVVTSMAAAFRSDFDRLDILVNNAGGNIESRPVLESDPSQWVGGWRRTQSVQRVLRLAHTDSADDRFG
jgi:NAD(P)-dependent dehydrogenase (short-subunit alcohol dehydrogenase family)